MKYRVRMSGMAYMRGTVEVEAATREEAEGYAKAESGNALWDYQGMDEDTIEVDSVEPSSPSFRGEF